MNNDEQKRSIVMLNGSPHNEGATARALELVEAKLIEDGIDVKKFSIGCSPIAGCIACGFCKDGNGCVYNDKVNEVSYAFSESDGIIIGTPVYYASPNGSLICFLDRLFHSSKFQKNQKLGISIATARRAGAISALNVINNYFLYSGMTLVGSSYWNLMYNDKLRGDDAEGAQTMKNLADNLIKALRQTKASD